jgi:DNA repair exonuclease SbcCD ATPase subunit
MGKTKDARKLVDLSIDEVSLVDLPANRRKFLVIKSEAFMDELLKQLEKMIETPEGAVERLKGLDAQTLEAIKSAVTTLEKVFDDLPDDIKEAVRVLTKYAVYGYGYPPPAPAEPATAEEKKSDDDAVSKRIDEVVKSIEALSESVNKRLEELDSKIKAIPAVKKSLEGDDVTPPVTTKWPSFFRED